MKTATQCCIVIYVKRLPDAVCSAAATLCRMGCECPERNWFSASGRSLSSWPGAKALKLKVFGMALGRPDDLARLL
jgi:hypothetical protein